jgi:glycosyltransferase involved in cell wall biosynthesis
VTVVYEGVNQRFLRPVDPEKAKKTVQKLGVSQPFILSVGTVEPRKNYLRLLDAYARLRERGIEHRLLIAGRLGWLYEPILARVETLRLGAHVAIVQPDDEALAAMYSLADACVFPSLYEGFGIPLLEALATGTPVACSDASSFPEIVGDAAITFQPYDVESIVVGLERVLTDADLRRQLAALGPERASRFSWVNAAEGTVQAYRRALAHA